MDRELFRDGSRVYRERQIGKKEAEVSKVSKGVKYNTLCV
jgi:hypothetical protein